MDASPTVANKGVCTSFKSWGFTGAVITWLSGQRCPAKDCHVELPFDEDYRPKPAALAMLKVLQQAAAESS